MKIKLKQIFSADCAINHISVNSHREVMAVYSKKKKIKNYFCVNELLFGEIPKYVDDGAL